MRVSRRLLMFGLAAVVSLLPWKAPNSPFGVLQAAESESAQGQGQHPRLFFDDGDIARLQAAAASSHQEIWTPIHSYVKSQLGSAPPKVAPTKGSLRTYRTHGQQLIPIAFACVVTEQDQICELAKTYLLTFANWNQWGDQNRRDLGHAHMLMGNALAYDWLHSRLSGPERDRVRKSLGAWAQKMHEASLGPKLQNWRNWWHKSYIQNHFSTDNSALGMAGLALLGEDERAQGWVIQAREQLTLLQYLLNGIGDGSWHEGIEYQNYGLTMSLPFLLNLRKIQMIDILPHRYLRNYTYWRLYNHIPNSTEYILSYGNVESSDTNGHRPQNILRFVANEYREGHAEWMAQQLISAHGRFDNVFSAPWYVFEFLYYDDSVQPQGPSDLPTTRTFSDLEGVIWRTGWDPDDLIFGLKSGPYGGRFAFESFVAEAYPWPAPCSVADCKFNFRHGHDDTNTFYIHNAGQWLAPEMAGVGETETAFHNTILIDGQGQYRPNDSKQRDPKAFRGRDGYLEATANTPNFDYVASDATRRYSQIDGIEDVTRHVLFVRPTYFLMLDSIKAKGKHTFEWVCHFGEKVSVEAGAILGEAGDGQLLEVGLATPEGFEVNTGNDGKPYVRIRTKSPTDSVRFVNLLYPTRRGGNRLTPDAMKLEDNGRAVSLRVSLDAESGRTDDLVLNYSEKTATLRVGPYEYDGRVAVVSRDGEGRLAKVFLYGGSFLKNSSTGIVLAQKAAGNDSFEAVYDDASVSVVARTSDQIRLYAPRVKQVILNGFSSQFERCGEYIILPEASDDSILMTKMQ